MEQISLFTALINTDYRILGAKAPAFAVGSITGVSPCILTQVHTLKLQGLLRSRIDLSLLPFSWTFLKCARRAGASTPTWATNGYNRTDCGEAALRSRVKEF